MFLHYNFSFFLFNFLLMRVNELSDKNTKYLLYNDNNINLIHNFVLEKINDIGVVTFTEIKKFISDNILYNNEEINLYLYLDTKFKEINIKDKRRLN